MNTTVQEAVQLVEAIEPELNSFHGITIVLCPPFISLTTLATMLKGTAIKLGAQNIFYESSGAFTGEVSPLMLAGLAQFVIIGHSERRAVFGETDHIINLKVKAALKFNLQPILCIGETLEERSKHIQAESVLSRLRACLTGIPNCSRLVVAYEPIWAIGTGHSATGDMVNSMMDVVRDFLQIQYGADGVDVPLIYGGSVTLNNIDEFITQPNVNGALVGGASLNGEDFVAITGRVAKTGPIG